MNVLIDTSAVLRVLLGQDNPVSCWGEWQRAYASELLRTEFFRTIDRLRLEGKLNDMDRVNLRRDFELFWKTCYRIPVSARVLDRASDSFPTVLGTLDAIHLSTLLLTRGKIGLELTLISHDTQLARAALACGVEVMPHLDCG